MPIQTQTNGSRDDGPITLYECVPELGGQPKNIGWNLQPASAEQQQQQTAGPSDQTSSTFLADLHVSHKQISDHFTELFTLFEDYTKILRKNEQEAYPKLKRSQSVQFTASHHQPVDGDCHAPLKTSISLTSMDLTDSTLLARPMKLTRDMASQTYWPDLTDDQQLFLPPAEVQKLRRNHEQQQQQRVTGPGQAHTLHIEVESISSSTALRRAPLGQRLLQVVYETRETLVAGLAMLGENITYVIFVMLCLWCLYLIVGHYYNFIGNNRNYEVKSHIHRHAKPIVAEPRSPTSFIDI